MAKDENLGTGEVILLDTDEEATIKITRGPKNTVGVNVQGELKMIDRKEIKKRRVQPKAERVDEGVIGMTEMPGLRRMQQLAGIPAADPKPHLDTYATPALVTPHANSFDEEDTYGDDAALDADIAAEVPMNPDLGAEPNEPEAIDLPAADAGFDSMDDAANELGGGFGSMPPAGAHDDINVALDDIETLLPKVPVGEFKAVIDRLRSVAQRAEDMRRSLVMEAARAAKKKPVIEGKGFAAFGKKTKSKKDDRVVTFNGKDDEKAKKESAAPKSSLHDYIAEMESNIQTIGTDQNSAIDMIHKRMGGQPQDKAKAQQAFQKLRSTGKIKQNGTNFEMDALGDDEFGKLIQ